MSQFFLWEASLQFFDNSGNPLNGGLVYHYSAGTTNDLDVYSDSTGSTPLAQPVVLDSAGRPNSGGGIWLSASSYKFVVKTSGGSVLSTIDSVNPGNVNTTLTQLVSTGNVTLQQSTAATSGANHSSNTFEIDATYWDGSASQTDKWQLVDTLGSGSNPTSTLTLTHSGSTGTAAVSLPALKAADNVQYAHGFNATDPGAGIASAWAALPSTGGVVDARGYQGTLTTSTNPFASLDRPLILLLGDVTIQTSTMWNILTSDVAVIGAGWAQTVIQYTGGAAAACFKVGTASPTSSAIARVKLQDFRIKGNGSSTDALFINGCHYSVFDSLDLRDCTTAGLHTQFCVVNTYKDIRCSLNNGAFANQPVNGLLFDQVDSSHATTASTVIDPLIEGVSGSGIKLTGASAMVFTGGTSEQNNRGIEISSAATNHDNTFIGIDLESNTTEDVLDNGEGTTYIGLYSSKTFHVGASGANIQMLGGETNSITVDSGAANVKIDTVYNTAGTGTLSDSGTDTVLRLINKTGNAVTGSPWTYRDVIPQTTVAAFGTSDKQDFVRGVYVFTTSNSTISTTAVSGNWRVLFIGNWLNNFDGGGLAQPAPIIEATTASPVITIGSLTLTISKNGSNQLQALTSASKIVFSGSIFVCSQTSGLGTAGTASALLQGSVTQMTANGAKWIQGQNSELLTLSTSGTTTDTSANLLPANSIIEAVLGRVTTTITTATDWKLGDPTTAGRFTAADSTMTAGETQVGILHWSGAVTTLAAGPSQASAAKVRVTTTGTPGAGVIRLTVFYRQFVAPTS